MMGVNAMRHAWIAAALVACGSKAPAPQTPPPVTTETHAAPIPPPESADQAKPVEAEKPAPPKSDPKADALAAETAAYETAKPMFEKACATCHTKAGKKSAKKKLDHFDMDTYPFGGHHTATIGFTIRDVLGISGKKATMPYDKPGSVKGDDLAAIKAWTDAWETAEKAGAHPPHGAEEDKD
jgi:mono/diheme cytochrome c family protein